MRARHTYHARGNYRSSGRYRPQHRSNVKTAGEQSADRFRARRKRFAFFRSFARERPAGVLPPRVDKFVCVCRFLPLCVSVGRAEKTVGLSRAKMHGGGHESDVSSSGRMRTENAKTRYCAGRVKFAAGRSDATELRANAHGSRIINNRAARPHLQAHHTRVCRRRRVRRRVRAKHDSRFCAKRARAHACMYSVVGRRLPFRFSIGASSAKNAENGFPLRRRTSFVLSDVRIPSVVTVFSSRISPVLMTGD